MPKQIVYDGEGISIAIDSVDSYGNTTLSINVDHGRIARFNMPNNNRLEIAIEKVAFADIENMEAYDPPKSPRARMRDKADER